jgi:hypothetical protein
LRRAVLGDCRPLPISTSGFSAGRARQGIDCACSSLKSQLTFFNSVRCKAKLESLHPQRTNSTPFRLRTCPILFRLSRQPLTSLWARTYISSKTAIHYQEVTERNKKVPTQWSSAFRSKNASCLRIGRTACIESSALRGFRVQKSPIVLDSLAYAADAYFISRPWLPDTLLGAFSPLDSFRSGFG